jgi:hypothetical protein
MWQVISKEIGNSPHNCSIHLCNNTELVTDPQIVSERFNSFLVDVVDELLTKNNSHTMKATLQHVIPSCSRPCLPLQ